MATENISGSQALATAARPTAYLTLTRLGAEHPEFLEDEPILFTQRRAVSPDGLIDAFTRFSLRHGDVARHLDIVLQYDGGLPATVRHRDLFEAITVECGQELVRCDAEAFDLQWGLLPPQERLKLVALRSWGLVFLALDGAPLVPIEPMLHPAVVSICLAPDFRARLVSASLSYDAGSLTPDGKSRIFCREEARLLRGKSPVPFPFRDARFLRVALDDSDPAAARVTLPRSSCALRELYARVLSCDGSGVELESLALTSEGLLLCECRRPESGLLPGESLDAGASPGRALRLALPAGQEQLGPFELSVRFVEPRAEGCVLEVVTIREVETVLRDCCLMPLRRPPP